MSAKVVALFAALLLTAAEYLAPPGIRDRVA